MWTSLLSILTNLIIKRAISHMTQVGKKPDCKTAMLLLIEQVKRELPLYESDTFICGPNTTCIGCPKKLLELVDTDLTYWESAMANGSTPNFEEIRRFAKLCINVRRGLVRNNLIDS